MKKCPVCAEAQLKAVLTSQGVEVDLCPDCGGIWLDRDEIFLFSKFPQYVQHQLEEAKLKRQPTKRLSPVSGKFMSELMLFGGQVKIDYCAYSGGIWLDKEEIKHFPVDKMKIDVDREFDFNQEFDGMTQDSFMPNLRIGLLPLPSYILSAIYGVLGVWFLMCLLILPVTTAWAISPWPVMVLALALVGILFVLAPIILDVLLRVFYRVEWIRDDEIEKNYPQLMDFLREICQTKKIKFPLIGIIPEQNPQTMTYGFFPSGSRIVFTQGLLKTLEADELQAVAAHEIGHIVSWDMGLMSLFQVAPILFYIMYKDLTRVRSETSKVNWFFYTIGLGFYILYRISAFFGCWFSKTREYQADRFALETATQPDYFVSALMNMSYTLAGREYRDRLQLPHNDLMKALEAFSLCNQKQSVMLSLTAFSDVRPERTATDIINDAFKWDLWNPWAQYYECFSNHPLFAKRLRMMNNVSEYLGYHPVIALDDKRPETYWQDFLGDFLIYCAPVLCVMIVWILGVLGVVTPGIHLAGLLVAAAGVGYFCKLYCVYPAYEFAPMNLNALYKKINISDVRPVTCYLDGKVLGRGFPGMLNTKSYVLKDAHGSIFLDYQSPLSLLSKRLGVFYNLNLSDEKVGLVGWYRRSPIPYIEVRELRLKDQVIRSRVYEVKFYISLFLIFIGGLIAVIF